MSISYLTTNNSFDLFANSLTSSNLITNVLQAASQNVDNFTATNASVTGTGTIATLVSNKLQTSLGSNYFAQYDATKVYKLGDLVVYLGLFYRCLINDTTGVAPDPNNPAQPQWVSLSSNNAIKNDILMLQVSNTVGDDAKALIGPVPFKTIQAAINFASNGSRLILVDQSSVFDEELTLTNKTDITIDGQTNGTYNATFGNVITNTPYTGIVVTATNCNTITFKNVIFRSGLNQILCDFTDCSNITFDNCVFDNLGTATQDIRFQYTTAGGFNMGDCIFYNCRSLTDSGQTFSIRVITSSPVTGPSSLSRIFILNHIGPVSISNFNNTPPMPDFLYIYFYNCRKVVANETAFHVCGNLSITDCDIVTELLSQATTASTNNKLAITNSSLFNKTTNTYSSLNKSGNCPFLFQNFDYDKNNVTSLLGTSLGSYTFGPAKYFNQLASLGTVVGTTNLVGGTVTRLPLGAVTNDSFDIINILNTDELTIVGNGFFSLYLNIETSTNQTVGNCSYCNVFLAPPGSTSETQAVSQTGFTFPLTSSTATYPTARTNNIILSVLQTTTTSYSIYFRSIGTTAFTVRMIGLLISQVR